jgi:hypothetical protein
MPRSLPWFWIVLAGLLLLLPGPAGRLLLDLIGGLTLTILLLPLLAGGAALIGWQLLRRRLRTCAACGFTSLGSGPCPACGESFEGPGASQGVPFPSAANGVDAGIDPRTATINVQAVDVSEGREGSGGEG